MFRIELTQEQVDIIIHHRQNMILYFKNKYLSNNVRERFEREVENIDLFLSLLTYEFDDDLTIKDVCITKNI